MAGGTVRSVAKTFGVSEASVVKWSQRFRSTASAAAKPMGGRRHFVLAGQRAWLLKRIALAPSVALRRLQAELADRGVKVSYGAVWDFVHEEGLSFKKTVFASEQDRPDVARRRTRWKQHQRQFDPRRLVFIDEIWIKTNMTRDCQEFRVRAGHNGKEGDLPWPDAKSL